MCTKVYESGILGISVRPQKFQPPWHWVTLCQTSKFLLLQDSLPFTLSTVTLRWEHFRLKRIQCFMSAATPSTDNHHYRGAVSTGKLYCADYRFPYNLVSKINNKIKYKEHKSVQNITFCFVQSYSKYKNIYTYLSFSAGRFSCNTVINMVCCCIINTNRLVQISFLTSRLHTYKTGDGWIK